MPVITQTQLENASLDAQSFESAVNDSANTPNPGHPDGTVTTRTGQTFYNLQASLKGVTDFSSALKWNIDTSSVVIEDPTSGKFRLDNADPSLATQLSISSIDFNAIDVSNFIATWDDSTSAIKGYIIIREGAGTSAFALYTISSLTDNGTWFEINVSYVSGSGAFTDEALIYVAFSRNGDKGLDGAGSGDVLGPASATDSAVALYDGTSGKLLKNGPSIGISANNIVQLNGSAQLPAVDGSLLTGVGGGGAWTLLGSTEASNSVSVDFTGLGTTYDTYAFVCSDVVPASAGTSVVLRVGDSGGFDSGVSDYGYHCSNVTDAAATYSSQVHAARSHIHLGLSVNNTGGDSFHAVGFISGGFDSINTTCVHGTYVSENTGADTNGGQFFGKRLSVITTDRVQFLCETGNITSGRFTLYGISHT